LLTPFLVPFVWWRNRVTASRGLEEHDILFPQFVRWGLGGMALLAILLLVVVLIQPTILIPFAPWKLTELTARILTGWGMLSSLTVLSIASDGRWSAARTLLQSALLGLSLTTLAIPRMWGDFNQTNPLTYLFVGGIILTLVALFGIHFWLERSIRSK